MKIRGWVGMGLEVGGRWVDGSGCVAIGVEG